MEYKYIIPAVIALVFGIAFLCWGIYQVKTGKMVAKRKGYSVDEPREVGVLFIYLGILGLVLSVNVARHIWGSAVPEIVSQIISYGCLTVGLIGPLILFLAGLYNLKNHRIFSLKTAPKTRRSIKKYYPIVAISQIVSGIFISVAVITMIFFPATSTTITGILFAIGIIPIFIIAVLTTLIELRAKK